MISKHSYLMMEKKSILKKLTDFKDLKKHSAQMHDK